MEMGVLLLAALGAFLALIVMGVVAAIVIASARNESQAVGATALPPKPAASSMPILAEPPYRIDLRPQPSGEQVEALLPPRVGPFERKSVRLLGEVHGDPIYAEYEHGAATVFVEMGINDDAKGAQQGLQTAMRETQAEFPDNADRDLVVVGRDPSYFMSLNRLGAFFAWTRDGYYFSAHAKRGEADLHAFMEAFPY